MKLLNLTSAASPVYRLRKAIFCKVRACQFIILYIHHLLSYIWCALLQRTAACCLRSLNCTSPINVISVGDSFSRMKLSHEMTLHCSSGEQFCNTPAVHCIMGFVIRQHVQFEYCDRKYVLLTFDSLSVFLEHRVLFFKKLLNALIVV